MCLSCVRKTEHIFATGTDAQSTQTYFSVQPCRSTPNENRALIQIQIVPNALTDYPLDKEEGQLVGKIYIIYLV